MRSNVQLLQLKLWQLLKNAEENWLDTPKWQSCLLLATCKHEKVESRPLLRLMCLKNRDPNPFRALPKTPVKPCRLHKLVRPGRARARDARGWDWGSGARRPDLCPEAPCLSWTPRGEVLESAPPKLRVLGRTVLNANPEPSCCSLFARGKQLFILLYPEYQGQTG